MRGSVAISEASAACVADLEECLNVEVLMRDEWAERRLGDLNLWISTSGSQAKGRASFDHRLASKPEIRAVVSNLLLMLSITIQKCKRLAVAPSETEPSSAVSGIESDRGATSEKAGDENELEEFELSDESSDSFDGDHTGTVTSNDDALRSQMRDAEDIIRQLSQITTAVRRSGRGFRLRKADQLFRPEKYDELRVHLKTMLQNSLQRWASEKAASNLTEKWKSMETPRDTWFTEIDSYQLTEVQDRLIKCNLMRRHRFIYQQRHSKKMEPSLPAVIDEQVIQLEQQQHRQDAVIPESAAGNGLSVDLVKSSVVKPADSSVVTGRTDRTGTTATDLSTDFSLLKIELKKPSATPTVISTTVASRDVNYPWPPGVWSKEEKDSSDGSDGTDAGVADATAPPSLKEKLRLLEQEYPSSIPKEENADSKGKNAERVRRKEEEKMEGNINFKCPCCCQALDSDLKLRVNNHRWRAHIADDLMPYTCIIPACEKPETMYPTKELWRQHLFKDHLSFVYWRCLACAEKLEFRDEESFRAHLQEEHARTIPSGNIEQLMSAWKKSAPTEIKVCPMCDFPNDQEGEIDKEALLDHIAIELQNFALRALPWADDTGQETLTRMKSSAEKVSVWMDDMLEDAVASGDVSISLFNRDWADDGSLRFVPKPPLEPMAYLSDHFSPGRNDYFGDEPVRSSLSKGSGALSARAQLDMLKEEEGSSQLGTESDMNFVSNPNEWRREAETRQGSNRADAIPDTEDALSTASMSPQLSNDGSETDTDTYNAQYSARPFDGLLPRDSLELVGQAHRPSAPDDYDGLCHGVEKEGANFVSAWKGDLDHALSTAARRGHLQVVRTLLSQGVRPNNSVVGHGDPLQEAACLGNLEVVRALLEHDADPNFRGGRYGNAVQAASSGGHVATVKMLLDHGADANAQIGGRYGTALQAAVSSGSVETVELLLSRGANIDAVVPGTYGTALQAACHIGDVQIVELLLDAGADVNLSVSPTERYSTALNAASRKGYIDVVKILLKRGAYVDVAAVEGASNNGHYELANLLEAWWTYEQPIQEAKARESQGLNSTHRELT